MLPRVRDHPVLAGLGALCAALSKRKWGQQAHVFGKQAFLHSTLPPVADIIRRLPEHE